MLNIKKAKRSRNNNKSSNTVPSTFFEDSVLKRDNSLYIGENMRYSGQLDDEIIQEPQIFISFKEKLKKFE